MKLHHILFCAALAVVAAPAANASDIVVTASTAASVSPGLLLKPDANLELSAGESVTLFGPSGPVEVKGPYSGGVGAAVGASGVQSSAISSLVKRRKRISSLAASRSTGTVDASDATQHLHLLSDGVWCVGGAAPQLFIRAEKKDRVVTLIGADGAKHEMLWPKNAASQAWPASAAFTAGARYQLMIGDIQMPLDLDLVAGPSGGDDGKRLEGYLTAGCAAQADALMTAMAGG